MTETEWYVPAAAAAATAAAVAATGADAPPAPLPTLVATPPSEPTSLPAPAPEQRRGSVGGLTVGAAGASSGRRRSWHIKMERKRRKGVFGSGGALGPSPGDFPRLLAAAAAASTTNGHNGHPHERHKRPSWWSIFVPDHWPHRSRRASQDVPRSSDSGALPWQRSKSRSVDHGFSAPFDLDSLRSKVEGRFESVDRLSRGDSDGGSKEALAERPRPKAPINTTTYTVSAHDTLISVAARFDTTPSELAEINRLHSRLIFPGQVLQVPVKEGAATPAPGDAAPADAASADAALPPAADGPASVAADGASGDRPATPAGAGPPGADSARDPTAPPPPSECRFLKINVRHITDGQGVVGGVLLVTPNAVMFDPNVSDPLVIEHGPESYGVIAPMEFVANAAIYHDIAHMRVSSAERDRDKDGSTSSSSHERPEVYHPRGTGPRSPGKDSLLPKDETFPELQAADEEDDDGASSGGGSSRGGDAFPKAFERELVTPAPTPTPAADSPAPGTPAPDTPAPNTPAPDTPAPDTPALYTTAPSTPAPDTPAPVSDADTSSRQVSEESCPSPPLAPASEERRRSTLDQHWPMPSSIVARSTQQHQHADDAALVKSSCHDSGIDIRDAGLVDAAPNAPIIPDTPDVPHLDEPQIEEQEEEEPKIILPTKKVYSDADIILAPKTEWVPPVTIYNTVTGSNGTSHTSSLEAPGSGDSTRKKHSSVSFSLESNPESEGRDSEDSHKTEDSEKQESRKNKMLKRLSYPLAWMEGFSGEKESDKDGLTGLPQSAEAPASDSQHHGSVLKFFSSSPINLVDFGTGLFTKTPSEESGKSPGPGPPPPTPANIGDSTAAAEGRSSVGTFIRQPTSHHERPTPPKPRAPRLDYRSMVSVEDMPELFVSFDIHAPNYPLLEGIELIPRPALSYDDPPLYLRLRMGKPINKRIPKTTPIMSYGKKKMRPEYWFSVPRNRVDELYNFLQSWVPHLYGDLDEVDPRSRGYELVESDTELWEDEGNGGGAAGGGAAEGARRGSGDDADIGDLTRESWEVLKAPYVKLYTILKTQTVSSESEPPEVLSMSEELRRALYATSAGSLDLDPFVPDLVGTTEVLSEEHRKQLCRHLPARAEGYVWTLVFSTSQHGFSLNSMYRKMNRVESPILLVIEDTEHNVFGALTSCALKVSDHFYGTGESLLFRFTPEFQVFNWTGDNMYFIKGNNESLAIGAGDGKFGLWLDGDLYQGRTQTCSTYGNEPLAPQEDFVVKTLECWAFI